jgi:hypothetical protein
VKIAFETDAVMQIPARIFINVSPEAAKERRVISGSE